MNYWTRLFNSFMFFVLFMIQIVFIFIKNNIPLIYILDKNVLFAPLFFFGAAYIWGEIIEWIKENRCMMIYKKRETD